MPTSDFSAFCFSIPHCPDIFSISRKLQLLDSLPLICLFSFSLYYFYYSFFLLTREPYLNENTESFSRGKIRKSGIKISTGLQLLYWSLNCCCVKLFKTRILTIMFILTTLFLGCCYYCSCFCNLIFLVMPVSMEFLVSHYCLIFSNIKEYGLCYI